MNNKAFALLSGGPDSTIMAYLLKKNKIDFEGIYIDYGHPSNKQEFAAVNSFAKLLDVKLNLIDIHPLWKSFDGLEISQPELIAIPCCGTEFYPQYLIAGTYVVGAGGKDLYVGIQKNDIENYPDMLKILELQQRTIHVVPGKRWELFSYKFPLEKKLKREVLQLGNELGVPLEKTWSCFSDTAEIGGMHCGVCEGCKRRQAVFKETMIKDETKYNQ